MKPAMVGSFIDDNDDYLPARRIWKPQDTWWMRPRVLAAASDTPELRLLLAVVEQAKVDANWASEGPELADAATGMIAAEAKAWLLRKPSGDLNDDRWRDYVLEMTGGLGRKAFVNRGGRRRGEAERERKPFRLFDQDWWKASFRSRYES